MGKISAEDRERIHKILDMVLDRSETENGTWFRFSGHVLRVEVETCEGKWTPFCDQVTLGRYIGEEYSNLINEATWEEMEDALCLK